MLQFLSSATALAVAASGAIALYSPAGAAPDVRAATTPYALSAFGVGTAVTGGDLPVSSGKTAYRIIGCTNRAPVSRENHEAEATVPGLGVVSGVKTDVWTTSKGGEVASNARHSVARIVIDGDSSGTLELEAIRSTTRAWHDDQGFHAKWDTDIGRITYTPVEGGPSQVFPAPAPGETLTFPGLATVKLGSHARKLRSDGAAAYATTLKIHVIASNTMARVAHTSAKIGGGVKSALFRGNSNATRAEGLDGNLTSGPTPFLPMPCQGTDGKVRTNNLAELDLGGQVQVSGANTSQMGKQTHRAASGFEKSSIAEAVFGDGQLVIQGIVARANVSREGSRVHSDVKGTTIGSITADGEPQEIPDPGETLVIDGVASIRTRVVDRTKTGISVTALRVSLLDGTGAVVNLGQAELRILRSGR